MSLADFWYRTKLLYLSQPSGERSLYKALRDRPVNTLLEVGIDDGRRTTQLLGWLNHQGVVPVKYAAIDPFEAAPNGHLAMKDAYKLLSSRGLKPCLVPGSFTVGWQRVLHTIGQCDLIVCNDPNVDLLAVDVQQAIVRLLSSGGSFLAGSSQKGYQVVDCSKFVSLTFQKAA